MEWLWNWLLLDDPDWGDVFFFVGACLILVGGWALMELAIFPPPDIGIVSDLLVWELRLLWGALPTLLAIALIIKKIRTVG